MPQYTVVSGVYGRRETKGGPVVKYRAGDTLELTAEEAERIGPTVREVGAPAAPAPVPKHGPLTASAATTTKKKKGGK